MFETVVYSFLPGKLEDIKDKFLQFDSVGFTRGNPLPLLVSVGDLFLGHMVTKVKCIIPAYSVQIILF